MTYRCEPLTARLLAVLAIAATGCNEMPDTSELEQAVDSYGPHYAIISTRRSSSRATARLNYSSIEPTAARFTVIRPTWIPLWDELPVSVSMFTSSALSSDPAIANLFVGAGATTGLVIAQSTDSTIRSHVTLEQTTPDGSVVLDVPAVGVARSHVFAIPIGDLHQGTSLLVGNPNPQALGFAIRYGLNPLQPDIALQPFGTIAVPVTQANTMVIVEARDSTLPVIVQLAVNTGKTTLMTFVLPPM